MKLRIKLLGALTIFLQFLWNQALFGASKQEPSYNKVPVSSLLQRSIGIASRPSVHAWQESNFSLKLLYGQAAEMNNFSSENISLFLEIPTDVMHIQLGLRKSEVKSTTSSKSLALTPFKQAGHASRTEFIIGGKYPLMEGIASQLFNIIPQSQFVLNASSRVHFNLYPDATGQQSVGDQLQGLFKTEINGDEYQNILKNAPEGMHPSASRHSLAAGLSLDQYFPLKEQALVISLEIFVLTDIHSGEGSLGQWMEYSLGAGFDY